jgi:hypothetical protein
LKQVSSFSGGVVSPKPGEVFRGSGRQIETLLALWPFLLGLAILLNLVEVFLRKGAGAYLQRASS